MRAKKKQFEPLEGETRSTIPPLRATRNDNELQEILLLWQRELAKHGYFINIRDMGTVYDHLLLRDMPLLIEGDPGAGKTFLVNSLAKIFRVETYRQSVYPGIDKNILLYHFSQDLIRVLVGSGDSADISKLKQLVYSEQTLVPGICLQMLRDSGPHVFGLFDEIDKLPENDPHGAEAVLLEFLGEFAVTVSELKKRFRPVAKKIPHIFLTSNAGIAGSSPREHLSYPMLRRSRRLFLESPSPDRQVAILVTQANAPLKLAQEVVAFCEYLADRMDFSDEARKRQTTRGKLQKALTISEIIGWTTRLVTRNIKQLSVESIIRTMDDLAKLERDRREIYQLIEGKEGGAALRFIQTHRDAGTLPKGSELKLWQK